MPGLVWLQVFFLFFLSGLFMLFDAKKSPQMGGMPGLPMGTGLGGASGGGKWYLKLGLLSFAFNLGGIFMGSWIYNSYFKPYWTITENASYDDVLPSEPAAAHMDAGKLLFAMDSRVAVSQGLGYKSRSVFCVAPIVDYSTHKIEYWAAGENCCGQRKQFNCDDVGNSQARSAIILTDNLDEYKKAAKQCA